MRLALAFALLASPALAGVEDAVERHIRPGVAAFADAAGALAEAAEADCTADALRPAYLAAWDAWASIADLRLGPAGAAGTARAGGPAPPGPPPAAGAGRPAPPR